MNAPINDPPPAETPLRKPLILQRVFGITVPFLAGILAWSAVDHAADSATVPALVCGIGTVVLLIMAWGWSAE